jgi:signal transduction histidine kinase
MKLVTRLTLAFAAVSAAVLVVNGAIRVERELRAFREDRVLDHRRIAQALAHSASAVSARDGVDAARSFIREANARDTGLTIRWVCADGSPPPPVPCSVARAIAPGSELSQLATDPQGRTRLYTWTTISPGAAEGVIEVSEPSDPEPRYTRQVLLDSLVSAITMAVAFAITAFVLGMIMVARPTAKLIEAVRRIGRGDFTADARSIAASDELHALAVEMDAMALDLRAATIHAAAESRARIAALEQLRHADRLLTAGRLASGIAHDMGTPLNVIEIRASMIANGEISGESARSAAAAVVESCEHLTRTIKQLLAFARPTTMERTSTDVGRLVVQTVELVSPLAAKARVNVEVDVGGSNAVTLDEVQIQQVLTNLIVNAIQAPSTSVSVRCETVESPSQPDREGSPGPCVLVRVEDDGPGIPPERVSQVFEPFFTTKGVGLGTGLGLSMAQTIVQDHGGWINVQSELGRGTVFDVFLPMEAHG